MVVALLLLVATLAQSLCLSMLWLSGYTLLYAWLTQCVQHCWLQRIHILDRHCLPNLDATHAGVLVVLIGFSLIPVMMLVIGLAFNLLLNGVRRHILVCSGTLLLSTLLTASLFDFALQLETPPVLAIGSILAAALYLGSCAYHHHRQMQGLEQSRQRLQQQHRHDGQRLSQLCRYLPQQLQTAILQGLPDSHPATHRSMITVFFSDIQGFTELTERLEAESLTELINDYLDAMMEIALYHGGCVDKFAGDSLIVFFGDPISQGRQLDALAAIDMALAMRQRLAVLCRQWRNTGIDNCLSLRMGLSSGYCTVGSFGTTQRLEHTIIGAAVNLASRLEQLANPGEILLSQETYLLTHTQIHVEALGPQPIKGLAQPRRFYRLHGRRRPLLSNG